MLAPALRGRVRLIGLPTDDREEHAAIVNAVQRHARVIVQKSLQEGFGFAVTEAMWKGRAVVASAVGGMQDQIEHGHNGLLLRDPRAPAACGAAIRQLLRDPDHARRLGANARRAVRQRYLGLRSLGQFADLIERIEHRRLISASREQRAMD